MNDRSPPESAAHSLLTRDWEQELAAHSSQDVRARAAGWIARRFVGTATELRAATFWAKHMRALPHSADRLAAICTIGRAFIAPAPYLKPVIVEVGLETLGAAPSSSARFDAAGFVEWFASDSASRERAVGYMLEDAHHSASVGEHVANLERTLPRLEASSALRAGIVTVWQEQVCRLPDPSKYLRSQLERTHWPDWPLRDEANALLARLDPGAST
jgi:hypothetical protein